MNINWNLVGVAVANGVLFFNIHGWLNPMPPMEYIPQDVLIQAYTMESNCEAMLKQGYPYEMACDRDKILARFGQLADTGRFNAMLSTIEAPVSVGKPVPQRVVDYLLSWLPVKG